MSGDVYLGLLKSCDVCGCDLLKITCPACDGSGNAGEWAEDEWCSTCRGKGELWWCEDCKHERWPKEPVNAAEPGTIEDAIKKARGGDAPTPLRGFA